MPIPLVLAPILAMLAKKGLSLVGEAVIAKGKDFIEEKAGIELKEDMPPEALLELQKWQSENKTMLEKTIQENLTARHESDMRSDSWLSKNVRPTCLLTITLTIMIGMFLPDEYVSAERYTALTDMSMYVYAYYFVGRSAEKPDFMSVFKKK
jgi:hypothetical protein